MTSLNIFCKFSCSIVPSSLRSLRTRLYGEEDGENGSPVKYKSSVIVPARCKTVHGLSRIWEMVEGGETQKFEDFSQTISNIVGSEVTVTASINLHEFSEAVQKIDTFESEVNELFTNLRYMKSMMTLATTLSADSGVPTSWGHSREESRSYEAGDSFTYDSDVSYIFDKRSKTTFTDEPDIWSESMLTDIDSDNSQSDPVGQRTLQGIDFRSPPLLLPQLPLPFFHCVRKTPKHTDLSFYLCEALNEMEIDLLRKICFKILSVAESKDPSRCIRVIFKSNLFSWKSINKLFHFAFIDQCEIPKGTHKIEATGYTMKTEFTTFSVLRKSNGPGLLYEDAFECLQCIEWPAYARERLLRRNGSFSEERKVHLMQHKCTLEHVQSEYSPFLWRFTSKFQERYLIEHLNDLQWNCLFAMGILLKGNTVLTDEAFCMSLFYTMEMLPAKIWNERENYLSCLFECLCTLLQFVENSFVPNFFWPTNNILLETISTHDRKRVVDIITDIIDNPFDTFFRFPWAEVQNEVRINLPMSQKLEQLLQRAQFV